MQLCNHTQLFFLGIPNIPRDLTLTCEVTSASVHWVSSFNGGDTQTFTVVAFNVKYGTRYSERIPDMGENIYTLTIPAQNMAEYEQRSTWSCKYVSNSSYRSPDAILKIASMIKNCVLTQTFTFIKKCLIILFS